jgi:hypothetical protein
MRNSAKIFISLEAGGEMMYYSSEEKCGILQKSEIGEPVWRFAETDILRP